MSTRQRQDDWPPGMPCTGRSGARLAAVLRAAAAPAHPEELAGEAETVAAFRAASTVTAPSHRSRLRSVLARVLTVKAVIVLAVAGSAGAVTAATGLLSAPWASPMPPAEHGKTATSTPAQGSASTARSADPDAPVPSTTLDELSTIRLCQEYTDRGRPGNTLKTPGFRPQIEAAGSNGKVADYCATRTPRSSATNTNKGDTGTPQDAGKPAKAGKPESTGEPERRSSVPAEAARGDRQTTVKREPQSTRDSGQTGNSRRPTSQSERPSTPGSPAHGTAVPQKSPGGAGPPSQGG